MSKHPAIFLDRDGVIIENRANYVRSWDDVEFYEQALTALAQIRHSPYTHIVVTNHTAVGRGLITLEQANRINEKVVEVVRGANGRIDAVYLCPHAPHDNCNCRKPQPGLLLQAAADLQLDLRQSFMIGDALTDIQAGLAAQVRQTALLLTGRGLPQSQLPAASSLAPLNIFADLATALAKLLP
jgi:D-glycero-D-manno-heptose 1,7-bisphosphate phosphatase